jgi:rubrerythrin
MIGESTARRVPALVRDLRARLRNRRRGRPATVEAADAPVPTDADDGATAGYFCRTCGAGFEGRHGTCPECGGGMIERGAETH